MLHQPSNSEAVEFLTKLRPPPWLLIAIVPDGPITAKTVYSADEVDAFVSTNNGKRNIYYSVNPTKTAMNKKPKKIDIAAIEYLLSDLDPKDNEKSEDAKVRYLDQLNGSFEPKPTGLVDLGNGIQGLWKLTTAIDLSCYPLAADKDGKPILSAEAQKIVDDAEARSEATMLRLGTKAGTQNIDRILRLPGTTNLPNKAKLARGCVECPTKLLAFNGASYSLDAFPVTDKPEPPPDDDTQQPQQEGDKLERIIRAGENGEFSGDRSAAVWWAVNEMLRRGYLTDTIVSTLLDRANKISEHVNEQKSPRQYVVRQIAKAKEKLPPPKPIEVLPELQWFGEKPATTPPELIKGMLPQTGVVTIGGQSGGGKTFHAIHLATRLIPDCEQTHYIDKYRIKRHGGVLYLVLEGKPAFPIRVTAAFEEVLNKQMEFGERFKLPFAWNTYAPNLFEKGPDALLKLAEREAQRMRKEFGVDLVAIFLDTMGLASCYENEDKSAQVLKVVSGLNRLSDITGALAINVDHMGKDQDAGLRGTSAKRDAVETIIACLIDRDKATNKAINHRMQFFKTRDGEEGRVIPYRLKVVDMGVDEDGEPISTCVVRVGGEPTSAQTAAGS